MERNTLANEQLTGSQREMIDKVTKDSYAPSLEFRMQQAKDYMDSKIMGEVFTFFGVKNEPTKDNELRRKRASELLIRLSPMLNEMFEVMYDLRSDLEGAEREQRILLFRSALMIDKLKRNNLYDGEASKIPEGI